MPANDWDKNKPIYVLGWLTLSISLLQNMQLLQNTVIYLSYQFDKKVLGQNVLGTWSLIVNQFWFKLNRISLEMYNIYACNKQLISSFSSYGLWSSNIYQITQPIYFYMYCLQYFQITLHGGIKGCILICAPLTGFPITPPLLLCIKFQSGKHLLRIH